MKIIQISAAKGILYALDDDGCIWKLDNFSIHWQRIVLPPGAGAVVDHRLSGSDAKPGRGPQAAFLG